MQQLNYHHLYYFYLTAREGSIAKSSELLHLTPQTISGQISKFEDKLGIALFDRRGKRLFLTQQGKLAYQYAEQIFKLGSELVTSLNQENNAPMHTFTIGVTDVVPKVLAFDLVQPAISSFSSTHMVYKEGDFESLLAELAINKVDMILADRPLMPGANVKAYSHFLGDSKISFFSTSKEADKLRANFPQSLNHKPLLTSGDKSSIKLNLIAWLQSNQLHPKIVAEFDDSALLKLFGQEGYGVFCAPSSIEQHVEQQYRVECIGRIEEITERYYAISTEQSIRHPVVKSIMQQAEEIIGGADQ